MALPAPPPCARLDASPAVGGREGSWETRAGSPGTLAAPPGASARPARPPWPGPQSPRSAPRRRPLVRPGCRPESLPPSPGSRAGLEGRRPPPARASLVLPPSARSARSIPLPPRAPGLAEPVLTRSRGWTAQPGPLPAHPPSPRARPGRTRQEPGRDAPALLGVLSACHLRAVEGRCRGEGEERRRGRKRGGAGFQPDGKAQSAASRVLAPNSGRGEGWERGEKSSPQSNKSEIRENLSCPRGLIAGKYVRRRRGPSPQGLGVTSRWEGVPD